MLTADGAAHHHCRSHEPANSRVPDHDDAKCTGSMPNALMTGRKIGVQINGVGARSEQQGRMMPANEQMRHCYGAAGDDRIDDHLCDGGTSSGCSEPEIVPLTAQPRMAVLPSRHPRWAIGRTTQSHAHAPDPQLSLQRYRRLAEGRLQD